jgi:hypothetical protein
MDLPECMSDGWDPHRPGREYRDRVLSAWEHEGYVPSIQELLELEE